MEITELNATNCKTYLLVSRGEAALVDPVRERVETYAEALRERGVSLRMILETHTHADHLMANRDVKTRFGVPYIMHENSPSPLVDRHVRDGDVISLGDERIEVLYTPGHTPDSVAYRVEGAVLTGDALLVGGTGRTDFPGGDAGAQYDAIRGRLFKLPEDTVVWPAHDYKGQTSSTIGREQRENPRLAGKTRNEYVDVMSRLGLPVPDNIQLALQVNQSGFEQGEVPFPAVADTASVPMVAPRDLARELRSAAPPLVLDVREPEEFVGELGHIEGALLVPLDLLARRLPKLSGYIERELVLACRAGCRSATAGAILKGAGFARVKNLDGGMLAWVQAGLPVQR